jgi:hypothetical protein
MSLDDSDPTDFEGINIGPVLPPDTYVRKDPRSNAATGASAASVRAFTAQAVAFYFRAPVKAFFRTRVDYLAYAKAISPDLQSGKFTWRTTTPGLLANAVRTYGWKFIPEQVMPPLLANVFVGAALYTSYLQILGRLHEPSAHATKVVYPPPPPVCTFSAGFLAGGLQSLIAAPLDALQVRFDKREPQYQTRSMWHYGREKLHDIGLRGIFAGWGLSFLKDSFSAGIFFSTFEYVKAQGYYRFVHWYYSSLADVTVEKIAKKRGTQATHAEPTATIRPHYALEPGFLMLAGISASFTQQIVLHPLTLIQTRHYERLEDLDTQARKFSTSHVSRGRMLRAYYHAYQETWKQCKREAIPFGGVRKWLFNGFWWSTIRQVPSTSAGLIIFELVRRKYGMGGGEVRINQDGYDILLT